MNIKEKTNILLEKYRKIQANLYNQIENVEFATNLLNEQKNQKSIFKTKSVEKINNVVYGLKKYKQNLDSHVYLVDIKISILEREAKKEKPSLEILNEVNQKFHQGQTSIDLPDELKKAVSEYGVSFLNKGAINLKADIVSNVQEEDLSAQ